MSQTIFPPRIKRRSHVLYHLQAARFPSGNVVYPPCEIDPSTGETNPEIIELPKTGTVIADTVQRIVPGWMTLNGPYHVVVIECDDDKHTRLMGQLTGADANVDYTGWRVQARFRRLNSNNDDGTIIYGFKWEPMVGPAFMHT
ncbi:MAG: OB-fold domain-containing protein [Candidatus Zixiibacteriota bacterium]